MSIKNLSFKNEADSEGIRKDQLEKPIAIKDPDRDMAKGGLPGDLINAFVIVSFSF